jgi:hypothetical protein
MPPSPLNDASAPRKRGRPPGDKSKKPAQGQQGRNLNYRHKQKQQQEQANHGRGHAIDSQTALRRGRGRPRKIQPPAGPGVLPLEAPNLDQDQAPNDEGRHEPPLNEESALVQTPPTSGQMDEPEPHGQDSILAGREESTQRDVNTKRKLRGQGAGRKRSATSLEAPLAKRWHAAASSSDLSSLSIGWNTED